MLSSPTRQQELKAIRVGLEAAIAEAMRAIISAHQALADLYAIRSRLESMENETAANQDRMDSCSTIQFR
jgi:hypothetical protein